MFKQFSLTLKMLMLTVIVGIAVWALLDTVQTRTLETIFQSNLAERFSEQAEEDRILFDRYVKLHHQTVKLFSNRQPLIDFVTRQNWSREDVDPVKLHRVPPPWLPPLSIIRSLVQLRYVLLLDTAGTVRNAYFARGETPPKSLLQPSGMILQLSQNQTFMTLIKGTPYLFASRTVRDSEGKDLARLMLISPLDHEFLVASQGAVGKGNMVALLTEDTLRILVSSQPELLPIGTSLDSLTGRYLITGEAFFDYGAADLVIKFVSLISTKEVEQLTRTVLVKDRQQRAITAAMFIVSFGLVMVWITQRIQRLTDRVSAFSDHMGLRQAGLRRGDQLHILEDRFQRLTEQIITETSALEHQALHDALTNLPNRTLLRDRLEQAILAGKRDNTPLALLIMDLDGFKDINDTLGHHIGDMMLQQVGYRLLKLLRKTDTISRLGGDEFSILLPAADTTHAIMIAKKVLEALEQPFVIEGNSLGASISVGVVLFPKHGEDPDLLLQRADVAMYVAKELRSGYALYDPTEDRHSLDRLALMTELRDALTNEKLELYYQPKINLQTGRVCGIESLLRWNHKKRGFIPPDEFIPLAEQTGLIRPITSWVINTALRQYTEWNYGGKDFTIAINLSARNLHDLKLPEQLDRLMNMWQIPPERLVLEVTESAIMADPRYVTKTLAHLNAMGAQLSIDDFGTGYSSLASLKQLPVDEIKIDKSFITYMMENDNDAAIVRATIDLAHNLGLQVVAEGVEDKQVLDVLKALGCDMAQGYYMCRPLPAKQVKNWLSEAGRNPGVVLSERRHLSN